MKYLLIVLLFLPSLAMAESPPVKRGADASTQERIAYAWEVSHERRFVYLLEAENDQWSTTRRSKTNDIGICQVNARWHPDVVNSPHFSEWKWQIDNCYAMYKGGVKFYGVYRIPKVIHRFN